MIPPEYVRARSVLLDALDGLGPHRDAVVLVGAQAVYLHTGDAEFVTAPTTTDADLALMPSRLADEPSIVAAMRDAGFVPGPQPGIWLGRDQIAVDLMVPDALAGAGGRRAARLRPAHDDKLTARRADGLEPALVDHEVRVISAFDGADTRSFRIRVAGPAALLVSKIIKVAERAGQRGRLKPKDGLDVLRLLRVVETPRLARSLTDLSMDALSSEVERGVRQLRQLASGPDDVLPNLAADAEAGFDDPDVIKMSMVALVDDLIRELETVQAG